MTEIPVVGAREPCPCGSGRRYKACHGKAASARAHEIVPRPFEGLASERDWVALREIVPAATTPLSLRQGRTAGAHARKVTCATVLPLAWPAMVRTDGSIFLGVQSPTSSSDPSRDLGAALTLALDAEPGTPITASDLARAAETPRLQELLDSTPLDIAVHNDFGFWGDDMPDPDGELAASLERASEALVPTSRLTSVEAAYWCRIGRRTHLRWVLDEPEEQLLDALARLHAARELGVGEGSKYVGAFRAHGLVVPVWDLSPDAEAGDVETPAAALRARLDAALGAGAPLTQGERRSRAGLLSRQLTLR